MKTLWFPQARHKKEPTAPTPGAATTPAPTKADNGVAARGRRSLRPKTLAVLEPQEALSGKKGARE